MFSCVMGREGHCKQVSLACVGSAHSFWATLGLPLLMVCVLSQSTLLRIQIALQGNFLKQALGCHALPRSKPLRFRYLGTPQRHRLSWACVLCPSQVRAAQVTNCLASTLFPRVEHLITSWSWQLGFLGVQQDQHLRCVMCLL